MIIVLLFAYFGEDRYVPEWFKTHNHPVYNDSICYTGVGLAPQRKGWNKDSRIAVANAKKDLYKRILEQEFFRRNSSCCEYLKKIIPTKTGEVIFDHRHHTFYALVFIKKKDLAKRLERKSRKIQKKIWQFYFFSNHNKELLEKYIRNYKCLNFLQRGLSIKKTSNDTK